MSPAAILSSATRQRLRRRLVDLLVAAILSVAALAATVEGAPAQEDVPAPAASLGEADYARLVEATIGGHVRPAYEQFAQRTEILGVDVEALCAAPGAEPLAAARRSFESVVRAQFALVPVRFGPVLEEHRQERIAFWPDPRGLGLKQVQALLAAEDPSATDPARLAGKSVGVQGLTALEFLLYDKPADAIARGGEAGAYPCAYGRAIAANLQAIAAEMAAEWEEGGAASVLFIEPGPRNPLFQTHKEAAGKIFVTAAAGLEVAADQMIGVPFGKEPGKARPKLAPFWRSEQSIPSVVSLLEATQHLVEVSGAIDLLHPRERWLGNSILFELRNAAANARSLTLPVERAVVDKKARGEIGYVVVAVHSLKRAIGRELTRAIGLEQGFNANDGD